MAFLQACPRAFLCKLFTRAARRCSVSGTRFTVLVVYTPVSVAKRCSSDSVALPSHMPRTNIASDRPCLISLRTLPQGDTSNWNRAAISPKNLRTLSSCCLSRDTLLSNHPACLTDHCHTSMAGVTSVEKRVSNSSLTHRILPLRLVLFQLHRRFDC